MPYWRLSTFYFFYFAVLGSLIPFWGVYLQSIGFNARQIGELMALLMFSRIIAPYIWGWLADHKRQRLTIVHVAAFLAPLSFGGVFLGTGFWWMAAVTLLFSFFWNATLPQLEAATMSHLGGRASEYGRVRVWGSVGFIIMVVGLGKVFDTIAIWWLLPVLLVLMIGIWLSSLAIPDAELKGELPHPEPLHKILLRPQILAFLLVCFLMQASHGPYYTFYTIYLSGFGYSKTAIGLLWAFGVGCEIGVFLLLRRLQARVSMRGILLGSFALAAVRWSMIALFPHSLPLLIMAQALHAATFGVYHATAIELVHKFFVGRHQTRGQAIYGSVSFGLGGAVGSYYAGWTWATPGPQFTYLSAAVLALVAFAITWRWLRSLGLESA